MPAERRSISLCESLNFYGFYYCDYRKALLHKTAEPFVRLVRTQSKQKIPRRFAPTCRKFLSLKEI